MKKIYLLLASNVWIASFAWLGFIALSANAETMEDAVLSVSQEKITELHEVNGMSQLVVYVGRDEICEAVSVRWMQHIQNFRICDGVVKPRNTVSPAWDREAGRQTFMNVVNNSILNGTSRQRDRNGYLISASAKSPVGSKCQKIEVIISYAYDLVDRDIVNTCN